MKRSFFCILLAAMTWYGCQEMNKSDVQIRFCADISAKEPCMGEDTVFLKGVHVWVQVFLPPTYKDTAVVEELYGYPEGFKAFIETKVHKLNQGQAVVMEPIFSSDCQKFEVEVKDTKGKLLVSGIFRIKC
jgi:hypothetical protein